MAKISNVPEQAEHILKSPCYLKPAMRTSVSIQLSRLNFGAKRRPIACDEAFVTIGFPLKGSLNVHISNFANGSIVLLLATLGGCSALTLPSSPQQESKPLRSPAMPSLEAKPAAQATSSSKLKALPVRPIDSDLSCQNKDEVGTTVRLSLGIDQSNVQRFSADVHIPKRGKCRFELQSFRQTATQPAALLQSKYDKCSVRFWEQGQELTVAFSNCESHCTGDTFSYLWPILVDKPSGKCS